MENLRAAERGVLPPHRPTLLSGKDRGARRRPTSAIAGEQAHTDLDLLVLEDG
jgi:hypothetical protein